MNPEPPAVPLYRALATGLIAVLSFLLLFTIHAWAAKLTHPLENQALILADRLVYGLVFGLLAWFWFERFLPWVFLFDSARGEPTARWWAGDSTRSRVRAIGVAAGVGLVLFGAMFLYDFFLRPEFGPDADRPHIRAGLSDARGLLFTLGVSALVTPVLEELFYRGILTRFLLARGLPAWSALLLQAICFGAAHPPEVWPLIAGIGLCSGVLFWRSGLVAAVVAHSVYNACILLYTFFAPAA